MGEGGWGGRCYSDPTLDQDEHMNIDGQKLLDVRVYVCVSSWIEKEIFPKIKRFEVHDRRHRNEFYFFLKKWSPDEMHRWTICQEACDEAMCEIL